MSAAATMESLQAMDPQSDVLSLLLMENKEIHDTLIACRCLYLGSSTGVAHRASEDFQGNRLQAIERILSMRAEYKRKSEKEREEIVVED